MGTWHIARGARPGTKLRHTRLPFSTRAAQLAALEIDRLAEEGRVFWYEDEVPHDLDICPSTLIVKMERSRLVHDWTRAGLNEFLVNPPTEYDTIDTLVSALRPNGFIAGLDIKDCFLHWPVDADSRRRLGVRHPLSNKRGVYLFLPPGLASAPGWNEQDVGEIVRVATLDMPILVARFVDDLRIVNNTSIGIEQDEQVLNLQLHTLKLVLEQLGMKSRSKPG